MVFERIGKEYNQSFLQPTCVWDWTYYLLAVSSIKYKNQKDAEGNNSAAVAKSLQLCPTLCDPRGGSPPHFPIPGLLQARTLEWVAISFSNAWKWKVKVKSLSHVRPLATPWTAAHQAPPSMGFSRQEYWSGVPLPSPNNSALDPNSQRNQVVAIGTITQNMNTITKLQYEITNLFVHW